jgi:hypothetical protein
VLLGAALLLLSLAAGAQPPGAQIEAVVLESGYAYGYGGTVVFKYRPAVLYSDGSYTFDATSALSSTPRRDGSWQRLGQDWHLNSSQGKSLKLPAKMLAVPAAPGRRLQGYYRAMSGVGAANTGTAVVAASLGLQFMPDGTVNVSQGGGAYTDGSHTQGLSTVIGGSRSSVARYRLEGYSITLTHPDGHSERKLFYFFPDGDKAIGFGASTLALKN